MNSTRFLEAISLFFLVFFNSFCQPYTESSIKVLGRIVDKTSAKPIEYATVSMKSVQDSSLLLGALADEKGNFSFDVNKPGKYIITYSFIGYQPINDTLNILAIKPIVRLNEVKLSSSSKTLEDVTVQGQRDVFENSIDKKVFNVDKSPLTQGGSGTDVLRQIPIVNFDQDGNIQMRGTTNVTVWINGRPSGMTGSSKQAVLDQIPASNIERVEIITNPSARYDAEGIGGIINIILKKNLSNGINGNVIIGGGTRDKWNNSYNKYNDINKGNSSISLNIRLGKWNISTNYGYRYNDMWYVSESKRLNKLPTGPQYWLNQFSNSDTSINNSHFGNVNIEFQANDNNTIGFGVNSNYYDNYSPERIRTEWSNENGIMYQRRNRYNKINGFGYNTDAYLFYRHTFVKPGHELYVNLSGSYGYNYASNAFKQYDEFLNFRTPVTSPTSLSNLYNTNIFQNSVLQIDYTLPITPTTKFEAGAKTTIRQNDVRLNYDSLPYVNASFKVTDFSRTNNFVLDETISAGYAMINQNFGIFAAQLGLRAEHTQLNGILKPINIGTNQVSTTTGQVYYNIFPSFYISKKFKGENEVRIGYSMRINRPGTNVLNPFPVYTNPLDLYTGNPTIGPEYVHSFEGTHTKSFEKHSISTTLYYRLTDQSIQRFRIINADGTAVTQFLNAKNTINYGLEFIVKNQILKWWSTTSNINAFQSIVNGIETNNKLITANFRVMSNMRVWKNMDIQVSGYYMLPQATLQGTFQGFNAMDIGVRKEMLNNKLILAVNLSDVFNTRYFFVQFNNAQQFSGNMYRQYESRVLRATLTYKFGSDKLPVSKRKQTQQDQGSIEGGF
ncbi:MAG: TonB-dependent receptor [Bacteroidota bacterium]|nr:TonB-dependent receptor [Bacteroidota bacterium]